jgi:hypothetical protein
MSFPDASSILLVIAAILALLSLRGYLSERRLLPQHKTWLTVAGIFLFVSVAVRLIG